MQITVFLICPKAPKENILKAESGGIGHKINLVLVERMDSETNFGQQKVVSKLHFNSFQNTCTEPEKKV